jgi:hypothetical protein
VPPSGLRNEAAVIVMYFVQSDNGDIKEPLKDSGAIKPD